MVLWRVEPCKWELMFHAMSGVGRVSGGQWPAPLSTSLGEEAAESEAACPPGLGREAVGRSCPRLYTPLFLPPPAASWQELGEPWVPSRPGPRWWFGAPHNSALWGESMEEGAILQGTPACACQGWPLGVDLEGPQGALSWWAVDMYVGRCGSSRHLSLSPPHLVCHLISGCWCWAGEGSRKLRFCESESWPLTRHLLLPPALPPPPALR